MATGDIKNNLHRLQTELRHVRYPKDMDYMSLAKGVPGEFVAILRYVMCDFSRPLAELILGSNVELTPTSSNQKFMEGVYKVLRDKFEYVPKITLPQFFNTKSFAEHKILLTIEVVSLVRKKHKQLRKPQRLQAGQDNSKSTRRGPPLPDLPENFKPCHNSTISTPTSPAGPSPQSASPITYPSPQPASLTCHGPQSASPTCPSPQPTSPTCPSPQPASPAGQGPQSVTPAVRIVVIGETPAPPVMRTEEDTAGVTPRTRHRRGLPGLADLSPTHSHDIPILQSELRTHPVIRDIAITVGDMVNRVRTLEEQMATVESNFRKTEQRKDAQILLLENKVKLLESQIATQKLPGSKQHHLEANTDTGSEVKDIGHFLETVVEEQENWSVLVIDEGVGSDRGHEGSDGGHSRSLESVENASAHSSSGSAPSALEVKGHAAGVTDGGLSGKENVDPFVPSESNTLQAQKERIHRMLKDTEQELNLASSLTHQTTDI